MARNSTYSKGKLFLKSAITAVLLLPILAAEAKPPQPPQATTIRDIADFVDRQGKFCIDSSSGETGYETEIVEGYSFVCSTGGYAFLFVPPVPNFLGFTDAQQARLASIDYAGLANHWAGGAFGTTFAGSVIERPLADGRAHVTVILRTSNALTWVADGSEDMGDFAGSPLLFGNRAPDVVDGGQQSALGSSSVELEFINTAPGDPLPDLIQLLGFAEPSQQLLSVRVNNQAKGPLTELFGVPDGTPGLNIDTQIGLLGNPQCGADSPSAVADCFPVERIDLRTIGR